ncbi:MAG TPA: hypothetical protein VF069_19110 [Streptosporangiaceae bacterium]
MWTQGRAIGQGPEPEKAEEKTMHPLFVELFINTQDDVLAEDEERRMRRSRRRQAQRVTVAPAPAAPRA